MTADDILTFYETIADRLDSLTAADAGEVPALVALLGGPAGRVLDIGAGAGRFTFALAAAGWQVTALDFSPAMLAVAEARAQVLGLAQRTAFVQCDLRRARALPHGPYDAAIMIGVLYHMHEPVEQRRLIGLIAQALKPGGRLFFDVETSALGGWRREQPGVPVAGLGPGLEIAVVGFEDTRRGHHKARLSLKRTRDGETAERQVEIDCAWHDVEEMAELLRGHGLSLHGVHSGWGGKEADGVLLVAEKCP
jgi:SAM-dependent methyltransferase